MGDGRPRRRLGQSREGGGEGIDCRLLGRVGGSQRLPGSEKKVLSPFLADSLWH